MASHDLEGLLKRFILGFIDDLKNIFCSERELNDMMLIECVFNHLSSEDVMKSTIKNILPYKEYIVARNKDFFVKNYSIFSGLPKDRVAHYTNTITTTLDEENIETIFVYFDKIIRICEKYQKNS